MLTIKNLYAYYHKFPVLKGINLNVHPQTLVSLIGMNGAGKTTLLNCLLGLHPIKQGEIIYQEKKINSLKPNEIINLGISLVPEGRCLFSHLTVKNNLQLGGYLQKNQASQKIKEEEIFTIFPILQDRKNQLAGSLSGGEQQMLAIARALMSDPEFLILDEPTLGLSPVMVDKVFQVINELKKKITIFLVEQNAYLTLKNCDEAYIIENGEIALQGKATSLIKNPAIQKVYLGIKS